MIRCNSEADSIVWMKEDMDKQDLKDRFKRLVSTCIHGSEIVLFQSLFVAKIIYPGGYQKQTEKSFVWYPGYLKYVILKIPKIRL